MGKRESDQKRAEKRGGRGRKRKRKSARKEELLIVASNYRPRRCSYGLWRKKKEDYLPPDERLIRERNIAVLKATAAGFFRAGDDCPLVVRLYAKLGLHRYNMLEGTNFQLQSIVNYHRGTFTMPASYHITLVAQDPATPSSSPVTFQTNVREKRCNVMDHICSFARVEEAGTNNGENAPPPNNKLYMLGEKDVPDWPSKMALADKSRFFYKLEESEWEEHDWIRLYLELAFVTTQRHIKFPNLSDLKISNVMVETEKNHVEPLKCLTNATIYISYDHSWGEDEDCELRSTVKRVDGVYRRRATVRRVVDMFTKSFCLVGDDPDYPDSDEDAFNN